MMKFGKKLIVLIAILLAFSVFYITVNNGIDTNANTTPQINNETVSEINEQNGQTSKNATAIKDNNIENDVTSKPSIIDDNSKENEVSKPSVIEENNLSSFDISELPTYSGSPYVVINNNTPFFVESDLTTSSYEFYSDLDSFGRCGIAMASIGQDLMPTTERGNIGQVKPSGWQTITYDSVDGKYLYNRCHLIGFQLSGENANEKNLITGTRAMNVDGMLPFENMVADYVKETSNHVLYRVTPIFEGDNLVATGVLMEAQSVEDNGDGILFCVFCYNAQPGIAINYADGSSCLGNTVEKQIENPTLAENTSYTYILNINSKKVHLPHCSAVSSMNENNKKESNLSVEELKDQGYESCGICHPF